MRRREEGISVVKREVDEEVVGRIELVSDE